MVQARIDHLNEPTRVENFQNLDQYYYSFMCLKYGDQNLVDKYSESWMVSFIHHAPKDTRIDMFRRFMGLNMGGNWPFSVFRFYL